MMSPWVVHRDPRWWPDPERFDPGRWTPEAEAALPRFAYFPFGGGPRKCIGEGFAWMEGVVVLTTLARRWRLRPAPGAAVTTAPSITLRPAGMRMRAEARH
jgi:cytochrome P450